jgi:hypothetical protein
VSTTPPAHGDDAVADGFRDVPLRANARDGAGPVRALSVSGALQPSGSLAVEFRLAAEMRVVRLAPAVCQPQRRSELWRHTCFELFVRHGDAPSYCEFNFSPSGDWAAYKFDSYRGAARDARQRPIEISVHTSGPGEIRLRARIDLRAAFADERAPLVPAPWRLNCAAVIECSDGTLSHWAVRHPKAQPDFHDAAGFCISLQDLQALSDRTAAPP